MSALAVSERSAPKAELVPKALPSPDVLGYARREPLTLLHPGVIAWGRAVRYPSDDSIRRHGGIEVEVIDAATGEVWRSSPLPEGGASYCEADLAAREHGSGPFRRRVTARWTFCGAPRELTLERPWSPPRWRNMRPQDCSECGRVVLRKQGYLEPSKKLGRAGPSQVYCARCMERRYPWIAHAQEERPKADPAQAAGGSHVEGETRLAGRKADWAWAKKRFSQDREKRRLVQTYGEDRVFELEESPPDFRRIATDYAANRTLYGRYMAAGREDLAKKVAECRRSFVRFRCEDCGNEAVGGTSFACGDRLCALCSAQRRDAHIDKVKGLILKRKLGPEALAMLTLTLQNVPSISKNTWRELAARFNTFRAWIAALLGDGAIPGGLRASEVTYRSEGSGYHAHLHVVLELPKAIPQSIFSDAWFCATAGAGYVADVRRLYDRRAKDPIRAGLYEVVKRLHDGGMKVSEGVELVQETSAMRDAQAAEMATRYVTKLLDVSDPEAIVAIHDSLAGVRLTERFGTWREVCEDEEEEEEGDDDAQGDVDHRGETMPCSECSGKMRKDGYVKLGWWESAQALARTRRAQRASKERAPPRGPPPI